MRALLTWVSSWGFNLHLCVCMLSHFSCMRLFVTYGLYPSDSSVHGILWAKITRVVAMLSFRESSWLRNWIQVLYLLHWQIDRFFTTSTTWEAFGHTLKNPTLCMLCLLLSHVRLCNPMDDSPPGSSVHGDSPGKNIGIGYHALLPGTFPTQRSNPGLLHCKWILYCLSHQGSPTY